MIRHLWLHRGKKNVHDPSNDLELALYDSLLGNNFLHYGYFKNPAKTAEDISLSDLKKSMDDYANLLSSRVKKDERVIEIGCGMGGLLAKLEKAGNKVTGVTPNINQAEHIAKNWQNIELFNCTLEDLDVKKAGKFDVVINSESFQYIDITSGIEQVKKLLNENGRWLMSDYFLINRNASNKSGHVLEDFELALKQAGLEIVERVDITDNVLPTLKYAHLLATGLALPVVDFSIKKFFLRHSFFEYLFSPIVNKKRKNIRLDTIDAEIFKRDKVYLLLTIKKFSKV